MAKKPRPKGAASPFAQLTLEIAGLGFILYSPFAVAHIADGEDYLQTQFWEPEAVAEHVNACTLTAFCTGSPGRYNLSLVDRAASIEEENRATMKLRLGIEVRDGTMCVRDLYDLLDWSAKCPAEQQVPLRDGFYRLTVLSDPPASGTLGDNQHITIYFEQMAKKPQIRHLGVPDLTPEGEEN
jgi:hypothetical protein